MPCNSAEVRVTVPSGFPLIMFKYMTPAVVVPRAISYVDPHGTLSRKAARMGNDGSERFRERAGTGDSGWE